MSKLFLDPGPILVGPGKEHPSEFFKIEPVFGKIEDPGPPEFAKIEDPGPPEFGKIEDPGPPEFVKIEDLGPPEFNKADDLGPPDFLNIDPFVLVPGKGHPSDFLKIEDPGPPDLAKGVFEQGWPSKWVGPGEALESDLLSEDILDVIERLDDGGVEGLLLPAVQKVAPAENMPFTYYKITDQDSRDALEQIDNSFDDNVVFLDPGGEQGTAGVFIKIGDIKGEAQDEQDMGAWSPLSDFSDSVLS